MTMHNPFFDADQMSLAELRVRIEADHELSVYKRRDIASACRSLAEWFHLPEASIQLRHLTSVTGLSVFIQL